MTIAISHPLTNKANYAFPVNDIEIINNVNEDVIFHASFANDLDADLSHGTATGTAINSAAVSSGKLDLSAGTVKYVTFVANDGNTTLQKGCIRLLVTPNYSGTPSTTKTFIAINPGVSSANLIYIYHDTDGKLYAYIAGSGGTPLVSPNGAWSPTAGVEDELEFNWDVNAGSPEQRFLKNGTTFGSVGTVTGEKTDESLPTLIKIGTNWDNIDTSDFFIRQVTIFNRPQHTADYTPTVLSSVGRLKRQNPNRAIFGATYTTDINGSFGGGVLTGTGTGSPVITGNKLDLIGSRKVTYQALNNANQLVQQGTIKVKYTPDYTGSPGTVQDIVTVKKTADTSNLVLLQHKTDGDLHIKINDKDNVSIFDSALGAYSGVDGTEIELEINFYISTGVSLATKVRVFKNGTQSGSTLSSATGTRSI